MSEPEDLRIGRIFEADKAPEYVLFNGKLHIDDLNKLSQYADSNNNIKFNILKNKAGHPYMKINNWKPSSNYGGDDLPPAGEPVAEPAPMPDFNSGEDEDCPF